MAIEKTIVILAVAIAVSACFFHPQAKHSITIKESKVDKKYIEFSKLDTSSSIYKTYYNPLKNFFKKANQNIEDYRFALPERLADTIEIESRYKMEVEEDGFQKNENGSGKSGTIIFDLKKGVVIKYLLWQ